MLLLKMYPQGSDIILFISTQKKIVFNRKKADVLSWCTIVHCVLLNTVFKKTTDEWQEEMKVLSNKKQLG